MAKISGIYTITCLINGKIYVGYSSNIYKRKEYHFQDLRRGNHHNQYLQNAWNKYGEENFVFELLEEYPCDLDILSSMEHYWCYLLSSHNPEFGYNCGITYPFKHISTGNKESYIKMVETRKRKAEERGYYFTKESRDKMSKNSRLRTLTKEERKTNKKKLPRAKSSIKKGIITRKSNNKPWHNEETKKKIKQSNTIYEIIMENIITGEIKIFNSMSEASIIENISVSTLFNRIKNKTISNSIIWKKNKIK